ncbi:hypothetical protein [Aquimarina algicola]|uniref:Uncharacterized protein n=1 Tax=Aquimarina algicola TaxID=2589995 RepID=A0A504JR04_9FLAO|nr:hypothetical protein [Aquimarina algicola]TPN89201.1 hypothetical protein FHK87_02955 [Aquimarina algicola]
MTDYNRIFLIGESHSNRPFRGVIENYDLAEPQISRGEKRINIVVPVKHSMGGKKLYDIVWTTNAFPLIVSERVIRIFEKNSVTGWETYDVNVLTKKDELINEKFFGLIITGRCGYRSYANSSIIMDKIGITMEPHVKGLYFKDNFWDGSDLFMCNPNENGQSNMYRFCTERVAKLLNKEKVKNIAFDKVSDITMSISLNKIELTDEQKLAIEKVKTSR